MQEEIVVDIDEESTPTNENSVEISASSASNVLTTTVSFEKIQCIETSTLHQRKMTQNYADTE